MATKKTTKTAAKKSPKGRNEPMYVVSQRTKLFFWEPFAVFETREAAYEAKAAYEAAAATSIESFKVSRVERG